MAEPVRCEQVVLGWSRNSLLGRDGFGPVFATAGWSLPDGDRDGGLGARANFLPQGAASLIADGTPPPECLAYEPTAGGSLLVRKSYARRSSRPGQYLVHAVLDPTGTLGVEDLFRTAEQGLLLKEQPGADPDRSWPPLQLTPTAPAATAAPLDQRERAALSVLLDRLHAGRTTVLRTRDQAAGGELVRRVLAVLPEKLGRTVSVCTYAADPAQSGYDLCLAVPPFSPAEPTDLDLDAPAPALVQGTEALVAELADGRSGRGLAEIGTIAELWTWLLVRGPLQELSAEEIRHILDGPLWRTFLRRVDESGESSLLLDVLRDPVVAPVLRRRLASRDRGVRSQLVRVLSETRGLDLRDLGELQDLVLDAVGPEGVAERVVPGLTERAERGGEVVVASVPLADALLGAGVSGAAGVMPSYRWHVDTSFWSELSVRWLERWLVEGGPLPAGVREAGRTQPEAWAAALDELLVSGRVSQDEATARLHEWPPESVDTLIATLLRCRRVPRLFVLDVLGGYPAALVRSVLRTQWADVARHAQLPGSVVAALAVAAEPRRRLFDFGRPR